MKPAIRPLPLWLVVGGLATAAMPRCLLPVEIRPMRATAMVQLILARP
jgi:hypothetical protein